MKRVDRDAMRRAIKLAKAQSPARCRQIEGKLANDSFEEVGRFAAYCCQCAVLGLRPWMPPPMSAEIYPNEDRFAGDGRRAAHALLQRLLQNNLSRFEPDPLRALRKVEEAKQPATAA
jgi:hypothetical protein